MFLIRFTLLLSLCSLTAQSTFAERVDFNKVILSIGGESWTMRDVQVYNLVLAEIYNKKNLSEFSKSNLNDFILSRVSYRESKNLNLTADKTVFTESNKKKLALFKKDEIEREMDLITRANSLVELKQSQYKNSARFNNWFDLMKRKYVVRIKATDIK